MTRNVQKSPFQASVIISLMLISISLPAVEVNLGGQVNRLVMHVNNEHRSVTHHADNVNSGTRIDIDGKQELDNGITVGVALQWRIGTNRSDQVNLTRREGRGVEADDFRRSEVWFSGKLGKLSMGKGMGASNGITEMDLSGTGVISYARAHVELLGNMEFYGADFDGRDGVEDEDNEISSLGANQFQSNTVGRFIDSFDGLGYQDRLRYDLPQVGPFKLAVSFGQGDSMEAAVRVAERVGTSKVALAAGAFNSGVLAEEIDSRFNNQFDFVGYGASISWLADSGLNLTAAYSFIDQSPNRSNIDPVDGEHVYGKVGYRTGKHAFSYDYAQGNSGYFNEQSTAFADSQVTTWGGAYVYNLVEGVEVYGSYRSIQLNNLSQEVEGFDQVKPITAWFTGSRVKF